MGFLKKLWGKFTKTEADRSVQTAGDTSTTEAYIPAEQQAENCTAQPARHQGDSARAVQPQPKLQEHALSAAMAQPKPKASPAEAVTAQPAQEKHAAAQQPEMQITWTVDAVHTAEVVTFEERKKTCIPSNRGLYVAEILLLYYCSEGKYPNPARGYPQFWWYEYGIQDVDAMLQSLETRGFLCVGAAKDSLAGLKVDQLKEILRKHGLHVSGKKAELVARIQENVSEEDLVSDGVAYKYALTEMGKQELEENAYVPYMHKNSLTAGETGYNVWAVNKLLGTGDKSDWKEKIEQAYPKPTPEEMQAQAAKKLQAKEAYLAAEEAHIESFKESQPDSYQFMKELLQEQRAFWEKDYQINLVCIAVNAAEAKYKEDHDVEAYTKFWEELWAKEDLLSFYSDARVFILPDLYIKAKRYDDARCLVEKIKREDPRHTEKADAYLERIARLEARQNHRSTT